MDYELMKRAMRAKGYAPSGDEGTWTLQDHKMCRDFTVFVLGLPVTRFEVFMKHPTAFPNILEALNNLADSPNKAVPKLKPAALDKALSEQSKVAEQPKPAPTEQPKSTQQETAHVANIFNATPQ